MPRGIYDRSRIKARWAAGRTASKSPTQPTSPSTQAYLADCTALLDALPELRPFVVSEIQRALYQGLADAKPISVQEIRDQAKKYGYRLVLTRKR
jgi:hypothetical protein